MHTIQAHSPAPHRPAPPARSHAHTQDIAEERIDHYFDTFRFDPDEYKKVDRPFEIVVCEDLDTQVLKTRACVDAVPYLAMQCSVVLGVPCGAVRGHIGHIERCGAVWPIVMPSGAARRRTA